MIFKKLSVQDFAGVKGPVEITFRPGINLIHGDNEIGKSTLVKAMYYALTVRAKVSGKLLDEIRPRSGASPRVTLELEHGGKIYSLVKCYKGAGGTAELRLSTLSGATTAQLSGDQAETELRRALSISADVSTGKPRPEECGILPLLWIEQGESFRLPSEALNDHARHQLTTYLASQTDQALSGQQGEKVLRAIEAQYLTYYTDKGKEKDAVTSPLAQIRRRVEQAEKEFLSLKKRKEEFDGAIERYYRLTRELEKLSTELSRRETELKLQEKRVEALKELERKLEADRASLKAAESDHNLAAENARVRANIKASLETQAQEIARLTQSALELAEKTALQAATVEKERAATESLKGGIARGEANLKALTKALDLWREKEALAGLEKVAATATEYAGNAQKLGAELARLKITQDSFARLDALDRELEKAKAAVEVAAAKIEVTSSTQFLVDNVPSTANDSREIVAAKPITIEFPGVGKVKVRPGGTDLKERLDKAALAQSSLDKALADLQVGSLDEARASLRSRTVKEKELANWKAKLEATAPKGLSTLEAGIRDAKARVEALEGDVGENEARDIESIRTAIQESEKEVSAERRQFESLQHRLQGLDKDLTRLTSEHAARLSALESAKKRQIETKEGLDTHRKLCGGDEECEKARVAAFGRWEALKKDFEKRSREYEAQTPAVVSAECERQKRVVATLRKEHQDADREIAGIQALLKSAELIGLHEKLHGMEAELSGLKAEEKRERDRAEACRLLYTTLVKSQQNARQRFMAPLKGEIEPFLQMIFPRATLEFDEGFNLRTLSRDREGVDDFPALSGGTKEQIGIIVRLALAKILAGTESVPVILDDAFGWTDDTRFEKMIPVLTLASRKVQILIFTCHWSRYRAVGLDAENIVDLMRLRAELPVDTLHQ